MDIALRTRLKTVGKGGSGGLGLRSRVGYQAIPGSFPDCGFAVGPDTKSHGSGSTWCLGPEGDFQLGARHGWVGFALLCSCSEPWTTISSEAT